MWVLYLQAVGPVILGALVAYVAWQQWRTARAKIDLDMFDRRFAWYSEVKEHLFAPLDAPPAKVHEAFSRLMRLHDESQFLFPEPVPARMKALADAAMGVSFALVVNKEDPTATAIERELALAPYVKLAGPLSKDLAALVAPSLQIHNR